MLLESFFILALLPCFCPKRSSGPLTYIVGSTEFRRRGPGGGAICKNNAHMMGLARTHVVLKHAGGFAGEGGFVCKHNAHMMGLEKKLLVL